MSRGRFIFVVFLPNIDSVDTCNQFAVATITNWSIQFFLIFIFLEDGQPTRMDPSLRSTPACTHSFQLSNIEFSQFKNSFINR